VKDAQIKSSVGECVEGTGHIAIHTMNLLLLDQNTIRLLQLKPYPISALLELPSEDKKEGAFLERWPSSVKKLLRFDTMVLLVWRCGDKISRASHHE
jgi:hypothetical protein